MNTRCLTDNSPLYSSYYQVIVIELATDNKDQPVRAAEPDSYKEEDLHTYEQARNKKPQLVPYIAAEFLASDFDHYQSFVVGDGERTPKVFSRRRRDDSTVEFYNGPLEENTFYAVFQRAYVNKVSLRTLFSGLNKQTQYFYRPMHNDVKQCFCSSNVHCGS